MATRSLEFGEHLRQLRKQLGLTLTEFYRGLGMDKANASRLERGLAAPPRDVAVLESLARALNLEPPSPNWQKFFDLAAASSLKLVNTSDAARRVVEQLPDALAAVRARPRRTGLRFSSIELENWAAHPESRSQFPLLIRQLIKESNGSINRIEFSAGADVDLDGWDGRVVATRGTAFVPKGESGWELTTGADKSKPGRDFAKRTKDPLGLSPRSAVFVFATLRRWGGKQKWVEAQRARGVWNDVRGYDAGDIVNWLEVCPRTARWLARQLGCVVDGIVSIDEYWPRISHCAMDWIIRPEVFLASRRDAIERLTAWLCGPPTALFLETVSTEDAQDFLAAFVVSRPQTERDDLSTRVVLVKTIDAWNSLLDEPTGLVLVPTPSLALEASEIDEAIRRQHHVLIRHRPGQAQAANVVRLPRANVYELADALVASQMERIAAERAARECAGNLSILRQLVASHSGTPAFQDKRAESLSGLEFAVLLGAFNSAYSEDIAVVEALAGVDWEQVESRLQRLLTEDNPPFLQIGSVWSIQSREDAWRLVGHRITAIHFREFADIARAVLNGCEVPRIGPREPLPETHGWRRGSQSYSDAIRTSVAETLVIHSLHSVEPAFAVSGLFYRVVRDVLRERLAAKDLGGFGLELPLMAEAAPDAFLAELERDLRQIDSHLKGVFGTRGEIFCAQNREVQLLSALEVVAWSAEFAGRVCRILSQLAGLRLDEQSGNSPFNSLAAILNPRSPATSASVAMRQEIFRWIVKDHPDCAWSLIIVQYVCPRAIQSSTTTPRWRDWADDVRSRSNPHDEVAFRGTISVSLPQLVDSNVPRWEQFIDGLFRWPEEEQKLLVDQLGTSKFDGWSTRERVRLAASIRAQIRFSDQHPDAAWALSLDRSQQLSKIARRLDSVDAICNLAWMFDRRYESDLRHSDDELAERKLAELYNRRPTAIQGLLNEGGVDAVFAFAELCDLPSVVGFVTGRVCDHRRDSSILPSQMNSGKKALIEMSKGYAAGRFDTAGWNFVYQLELVSWSTEDIVTLLLALPRPPQYYDAEFSTNLQQLGETVKTAFLQRLPWHQIEINFRPTAIRQLLEVGAAECALELGTDEIVHKRSISAELLFDCLENATVHPRCSSSSGSADPSWKRTTIIEHLQRRQAATTEFASRLEQVEWKYLELLDGHHASPVTLERRLAESPEFFAEVIRTAYRRIESAHEDEVAESNVDPDPGEVRMSAQRLLACWELVPGQSTGGNTIDAVVLENWVRRARELCSQDGRREIGDYQIGEILARAPADEDVWPCDAVRDVIDEHGADSDTLEEGFLNGTWNSRGMTNRGPFDGGTQERDLARRYRRWAKECDAEWPRTARLLRQLAKFYEEYALTEDADSEAHRLRRINL